MRSPRRRVSSCQATDTNMLLPDDDFARIIKAVPLVSIDLVLRDAQQRVLLGRRRNRPAQDWWFVPGGRIRKNEPIQAAFRRIAQAELGIVITSARLLGVFDHMYPDNYFGIEGLGTHYVVIACEARFDAGLQLRIDEQHAELRWWPVEELLSSAQVHDNTKRYFREDGENGFRCA
jgi:colanic acid biosynthesis protein WcaH